MARPWLLTAVGSGIFSSFLLISQSAVMSSLLYQLVTKAADKRDLVHPLLFLLLLITGRAICSLVKDRAGFRCGKQIRVCIRELILNKLGELGPGYIQGQPAGFWATLTLDQVESMQDFFAQYLPQMFLSIFVPLIILMVVFPINWAVGLIFLVTAPLVPLIMALIGIKVANVSRNNFETLQRLSGHFYDRLQSMTTIKMFHRIQAESEKLLVVSNFFRKRTMKLLRIAFLSSAVIEFFTSVSIAIVAVYFSLGLIGKFSFGYPGSELTLSSGLFILILAPEFYRPLRELGTLYHAKQQAIGAAESIFDFLGSDPEKVTSGKQKIPSGSLITLEVDSLEVLSPGSGDVLVGPVSFNLPPTRHVAIVGSSGSGKTSLVSALLGFLPYRGKIRINGISLRSLDLADWRTHISWVGQNPVLVHGSIRDNITLGKTNIDDQAVDRVLKQSLAKDFVDRHGLDHLISDRSRGLSLGQVQRLAIARASVQDGTLWLLDEPTASLDTRSGQAVMSFLRRRTVSKTMLLVTHQLELIKAAEKILVLSDGKVVQQGCYDELSSIDGVLKVMISTNKILKKYPIKED